MPVQLEAKYNDFVSRKMHLKTSHANYRVFCADLHVLSLVNQPTQIFIILGQDMEKT